MAEEEALLPEELLLLALAENPQPGDGVAKRSTRRLAPKQLTSVSAI